jgi:hypothetical protein
VPASHFEQFVVVQICGDGPVVQRIGPDRTEAGNACGLNSACGRGAVGDVQEARSSSGHHGGVARAGRAIFDQDPTPVGDPATYFFYHDGHPSTAVHRIVGKKLFEEIAARPPAAR